MLKALIRFIAEPPCHRAEARKHLTQAYEQETGVLAIDIVVEERWVETSDGPVFTMTARKQSFRRGI